MTDFEFEKREYFLDLNENQEIVSLLISLITVPNISKDELINILQDPQTDKELSFSISFLQLCKKLIPKLDLIKNIDRKKLFTGDAYKYMRDTTKYMIDALNEFWDNNEDASEDKYYVALSDIIYKIKRKNMEYKNNYRKRFYTICSQAVIINSLYYEELIGRIRDNCLDRELFEKDIDLDELDHQLYIFGIIKFLVKTSYENLFMCDYLDLDEKEYTEKAYVLDSAKQFFEAFGSYVDTLGGNQRKIDN